MKYLKLFEELSIDTYLNTAQELVKLGYYKRAMNIYNNITDNFFENLYKNIKTEVKGRRTSYVKYEDSKYIHWDSQKKRYVYFSHNDDELYYDVDIVYIPLKQILNYTEEILNEIILFSFRYYILDTFDDSMIINMSFDMNSGYLAKHY